MTTGQWGVRLCEALPNPPSAPVSLQSCGGGATKPRAPSLSEIWSCSFAALTFHPLLLFAPATGLLPDPDTPSLECSLPQSHMTQLPSALSSNVISRSLPQLSRPFLKVSPRLPPGSSLPVHFSALPLILPHLTAIFQIVLYSITQRIYLIPSRLDRELP